MNPTIEMIFTIVGGALVLLSVYGAAKRDRRLYNSGFCFYSVLPIIGESMGYSADKASIHILMIVIFIAQFLLQIPDKNLYSRENLPATALATKIGFAIIVFNAGAAVAIFCLNLGVPVQFGYYHVAFALIVVYVMIRRFTSNVGWAK
jgi:hypothetical protein